MTTEAWTSLHPTEFPVGSRIILVGLKRGAKFNGKAGLVNSALNEGGRQVVYVFDEGTSFAFRPVNLAYEPRSASSLSVKEIKSVLRARDVPENQYIGIERAELEALVKEHIGTDQEIAAVLASIKSPPISPPVGSDNSRHGCTTPSPNVTTSSGTGMMNVVSCSHSLVEINSNLKNGSKNLMVTLHERNSILLDAKKIMWTEAKLMPTGQTLMQLMFSEDQDKVHWAIEFDSIDDEDWAFVRGRAGSRGREIDDLREATELCRRATRIPPGEHTSCDRRALIEEALRKCPTLCPQAHYMQYELLAFALTESVYLETLSSLGRKKKPSKELDMLNQCLTVLSEAVAAGEAFVSLVRAREFAQGNFFSWVPSRWLVRSSYTLGCLHHIAGDLDSAESAYKACLGYDIHDKLGARHRQLMAAIERGQNTAIGKRDLKRLLRAKFTEDQCIDDAFALWNYTRALHAYAKDGECKVSNRLLKRAIERNGHVPPILFAWEIPMQSPVFMTLGTETEASAYVSIGASHWESVPGALEWLERIYCQASNICQVKVDSLDSKSLIKGTSLMAAAMKVRNDKECRKNLSGALEEFEKLAGRLSPSEDTEMLHRVLYRMALCKQRLDDFSGSVTLCNSALALKNLCNDQRKQPLYTRAQCKESLKDFEGALADYTYVWENIGQFSSAHEGMTKMENELKISRPSIVTEEQRKELEKETKDLEEARKQLLGTMPPVDSSTSTASTMEKCDFCQRGGIRLRKCAACGEAQYCSVPCQRSGWYAGHKGKCPGKNQRKNQRHSMKEKM